MPEPKPYINPKIWDATVKRLAEEKRIKEENAKKYNIPTQVEKLPEVQQLKQQVKKRGNTQGPIETEKQGLFSKMVDVGMAPVTAFQNYAKYGYLPDNFTQGSENLFDYPLGVVTGSLAEKGLSIGAKAGVKQLAKTLPNAHEYNPFAFKPKGDAYYRMIGREEGYKDAIKSGVIKPPTNAAYPFENAYYHQGQQLDAGFAKKLGNKITSYEGPYMAEVKGNPSLFEKDYNPSPLMDSFNKKSKIVFSKEHIPTTSQDVNLYKQHWLQGYKKVPKSVEFNQGGNMKRKSLYGMAAGGNYMTPESFNQQNQFNPNMGMQSTGTQKKTGMTRASPYIDAAQMVIGLIPGYGQVINAGIDVAQGVNQQKQNTMDQQYASKVQMQQQNYMNDQSQQFDYGDTGLNFNPQRNTMDDQDLLNQGEQRINNSQMNNPYGMANGGKKKTLMQQMVDNMAFNNSNNYMDNGGLKRSKDYGSSKNPYPSVAGNQFAGPGRSYPIPTREDAIDALRLAGLHGNNAVKAKVHQAYPGLRGGGNYGMIPGNGHSKADDKPVDMANGSYVIPNDTNSKADPKIEIAKSLLAFLGHDSEKKFNMGGGSQSDVNISSKEMVLNPQQSQQFDQLMGGEANKEAFFTPNSEYNNALAGQHEMPDGSMMPDSMMNKGGKKGLMGLCMQEGGNTGELTDKEAAEIDAWGEEQLKKDKLIGRDKGNIYGTPAAEEEITDQLTKERGDQIYKGTENDPRLGPNYATGEIAPPNQLDKLAPSYLNPTTGVTNAEQFELDKEQLLIDASQKPESMSGPNASSMGTLINGLEQKQKSGQTLTPQEQSMLDDYNKSNQPVSPTVSSTTPTTTPTNKTPGTGGPFEEAKKLNRNISGIEAGVTVGMGLYNLLTKYKPGQKPLEFNPAIEERDFMGVQNNLDKQVQLAGATARYNARNVNQTGPTNAAIHANELGQLSKNAAVISDLQQADKLRINAQKNEASLYNLASMNQYNANESQQLNAFRLQKGQVLSDNISSLGDIGKDYLNNKILIDVAEKGSNLASIQQEYKNLADADKVRKDPNNPIIKRGADGKIVYRKNSDGTTSTEPEIMDFNEYLRVTKKGY